MSFLVDINDKLGYFAYICSDVAQGFDIFDVIYPRLTMRKTHTVALTCGVDPIEKIHVDPRSRDEITRMILALKSLWESTALRNQMLTILQDGIGGKLIRIMDAQGWMTGVCLF